MRKGSEEFNELRRMFGKGNLKIFVSILLVFAIGLVGFYIFSAEYGDGLEVTMEEAGVEDSEPPYTSPLDYGDNYGSTLVVGIIGFFVTLIAGYAIARTMRKKDAPDSD